MPRATKTPTIPLPISLERWYSDPNNAVALRELLENEAFKVAVATLSQANLPTGMATALAPSATERMAWLAGYNDFARDLVSLTKPRNQHTDPEPWGHIRPQHL